jgi:hypothetical protein
MDARFVGGWVGSHGSQEVEPDRFMHLDTGTRALVEEGLAGFGEARDFL